MLCRYAEVDRRGTATIVGAGQERFFLPQVPRPFGFMLAIRLVVPEHEFDTPHQLTSRCLDPSMNVVGPQMQAEFGVTRTPNHQEGSDGTQVLAIGQRLMVNHFGIYTVEMSVDNRSAKSLMLHVLPRPSPGQPQPNSEGPDDDGPDDEDAV